MKRFKNILYVHDGSPDAAKETLTFAINLASQNGGRVTALNVLETVPTFATTRTLALIRSQSMAAAKHALSAFVASAGGDNLLNAQVIEGRPHIEIIREVIRNEYDLVIKPIGPSGFLNRLVGQLDLRLLRHCPCPVLLSRAAVHGAFDTVLAAVDGGEPDNEAVEDALNRQILELATTLCASNAAQLRVGHVWQPPFLTIYSQKRAGIPRKEIDAHVADERKSHRNWLNRLMRRSIGWLGADLCKSVKRKTHLREGYAGQEIPKLAEEVEADLIVMGTVARTGVSGLIMGNTAEQILDRLTCSVLAVKPPGFVSQVSLEE